jgi:hypothetical protein
MMTLNDAQIFAEFESGWCDGIEAAFEERADLLPPPPPPHTDYYRGFAAGVAAYTLAMTTERVRLAASHAEE